MERELDDPIGALQEHVVLFSKTVADSIWEVQQMTGPNDQKARTVRPA